MATQTFYDAESTANHTKGTKRKGLKFSFGRKNKSSGATVATTRTSTTAPGQIQVPADRYGTGPYRNNTNAATSSSLSVKKAMPQSSTLGRILCRTQAFKSMCKWAFDAIDTDGSGSVDEKELYSGLLLIHLKLGMYAGPPACRPLEREQCRQLFLKFDKDGSNALDRSEFDEVMVLLFSNVLIRVMTLWTATIVLVPLCSKKILDGVMLFIKYTWMGLEYLDEHYALFHHTDQAMEKATKIVLAQLPGIVVSAGRGFGNLLGKLPDSVWASLPLTLISTLLGVVVVPWVLIKIDEMFRSVADSQSKPSAPPATPPPTRKRR